jgi:catechol 2,3-dioxygenase-like lactoylglutathione lyase family enzyme
MPTTRVQLALNVEDIDAATAFYSKLFGVAPHKERPGYANFAVEDPPLKLVLFENAAEAGTLNHLGIEAPSVEDVTAALERFRAAGLDTRSITDDLCCHAVQDKVFVNAPDVPLGWWEYYAVTDDDPDESADQPTSDCCTAPAEAGASSCC